MTMVEAPGAFAFPPEQRYLLPAPITFYPGHYPFDRFPGEEPASEPSTQPISGGSNRTEPPRVRRNSNDESRCLAVAPEVANGQTTARARGGCRKSAKLRLGASRYSGDRSSSLGDTQSMGNAQCHSSAEQTANERLLLGECRARRLCLLQEGWRCAWRKARSRVAFDTSARPGASRLGHDTSGRIEGFSGQSQGSHRCRSQDGP